jgi:protein-tyrosine phosphatase
MIDLHCHVLPGIDDGPATIERSVELARAAVAAGTRTILATPHVSSRYPNDAQTIARLVDNLSARLEAEGVELEVLAGAEIAIDRLADIPPDELVRLTLGDGPWLLVESPLSPAAAGVDVAVRELLRRGHCVVLAHPERCPTFRRNPQMLDKLVAAGALTSITASALVGRFGAEVRRFALELAREGMVHNVATDAHDHVHRPPQMAGEIKQAGLGPLAGWLTGTVPAAILGGEEIPTHPALPLPDIEAASKPWWRRLGPLRRAL